MAKTKTDILNYISKGFIRERDDIIAGSDSVNKTIQLDNLLFTGLRLLGTYENKVYLSDGAGKILQYSADEAGSETTLTYDDIYFEDEDVEALPICAQNNLEEGGAGQFIVLFDNALTKVYTLTDAEDISTADYDNAFDFEDATHLISPIYFKSVVGQSGDEFYYVLANGDLVLYDVSEMGLTYKETMDAGIPDITSAFIQDFGVYYITDEATPKLYYADATQNPLNPQLIYTQSAGETLSGIAVREYDLNIFLGRQATGFFGLLQIKPPVDISGNVICNSIGEMTYSKSGASRTTNRLYEGQDLTVKFADEIADYDGNEWDWIKARILAENFTGIDVGDYIPFTLSEGTVTDGVNPIEINEQDFKAKVAGINTYKEMSYDGEQDFVGSHIDFITETVINTPIIYQLSNNNNGTYQEQVPWLSSVLYAVLNGVNNYSENAYDNIPHGYDASTGGVLQLLPEALQGVLSEKVQISEIRYNESGLLSLPNGSYFGYIGRLWIPIEFELFGSIIFASQYSDRSAVQYPLYAGSLTSRIKKNSSGVAQKYWLSNATSGSEHICIVRNGGYATGYLASDGSVYSPICFRIGDISV